MASISIIHVFLESSLCDINIMPTHKWEKKLFLAYKNWYNFKKLYQSSDGQFYTIKIVHSFSFKHDWKYVHDDKENSMLKFQIKLW